MTPTDRGYAHLITGSRGLNVAVSTSAKPVNLADTASREVFAVHFAADRIDVGAGVEIVADASGRRTSSPVAVHAKDGIVYLRSQTAGASLGSFAK